MAKMTDKTRMPDKPQVTGGTMSYYVHYRKPVNGPGWLAVLMHESGQTKSFTIKLPALLGKYRNPAGVKDKDGNLTLEERAPVTRPFVESTRLADLEALSKKLGLSIRAGIPAGYRPDLDALQVEGPGLAALAALERALPEVGEEHGKAIAEYVRKGSLPRKVEGTAACLFFAQLATEGIDGAYYNFFIDRPLAAKLTEGGLSMHGQEILDDVLRLQKAYLDAVEQ